MFPLIYVHLKCSSRCRWLNVNSVFSFLLGGNAASWLTSWSVHLKLQVKPNTCLLNPSDALHGLRNCGVISSWWLLSERKLHPKVTKRLLVGLSHSRLSSFLDVLIQSICYFFTCRPDFSLLVECVTSKHSVGEKTVFWH